MNEELIITKLEHEETLKPIQHRIYLSIALSVLVFAGVLGALA